MTRTPIVDPRTGETYDHIPIATARDVDAAVRRAAAALETWRATTPAERQQALLALAEAVSANAERIAHAEARNTGKPPAQVLEEEIPAVLDVLRFMAGAARTSLSPASGMYVHGFTSLVLQEPVGVCALITPWNYPLGSAIDKLAPALATGNTVVIKPAETTPLSTLILEELCSAVLPAGVVNVVCGDRDTGRALATHPQIDLISLTGSSRAGAEITATAGIKRLHLELGGNAPAIVLSDANLEAAAEGIVGAAMYNAGQDCTAASRVLADHDIYDELVHLIVDRVRQEEPGPLNNQEHLARVGSYFTSLPAHATVELGGAPVAGPGFHFMPTVVTGVRQDDAIVQDEVFGPVLTIQPFSTDEEAVQLANGVPYGLAASVWTSNGARAAAMGSRIHAGTVWINCHSVYATEMPHGGFKQSGYGKDLSTYALDTYTRVKHVMYADATVPG